MQNIANINLFQINGNIETEAYAAVRGRAECVNRIRMDVVAEQCNVDNMDMDTKSH